MVRPTAEIKALNEMREYLRRGRPLRVAAVFLTLAHKGPTMRFKEIWNNSIVREHLHSKSVLHETLDYMQRRKIVSIERISRKFTRITLLIKLPEVLSKEVDRTLFATAKLEERTKRLISSIEEGKLSYDEAYILVYGMFIHSERERLHSTIKLLEVYSDPVLWPFFWWELIQSLVILPIIFHLQVLRACKEIYPKATDSAIKALDNSLSKVLASEQIKKYWRVLESSNS